MKINKNSRPFYKKPLVWLVLVAVVAIVAFLIFEKIRVANVVQPGNQKITPEQAAEQKKTNTTTKQDFIENPTEPTPVAPPTDSDNITLTATQEGSSVTILTKLKGFAGGSCQLSITNGAKSHAASADIIYQPEFSSCAGFGIPVSQLGPGLWSITLKATPTGGSALTKTTTFEAK